jgi:hypothetical protein
VAAVKNHFELYIDELPDGRWSLWMSKDGGMLLEEVYDSIGACLGMAELYMEIELRRKDAP